MKQNVFFKGYLTPKFSQANDGAAIAYDFRGADTVGQAMVKGGLPITFSRTGTATYWDSAGVLQSAAENVARLDHNPADNTRRGLLIEEARTNVCLQNRTFTEAGTWVPDGTPAATANAVGITGVANSACTLTDNDGAAHEGVNQTITITNNALTHGVFIFIKKDAITSRFVRFGISYTGGTQVDEIVHVNTSTGALTSETGTGDGSRASRDAGLWWQVIVRLANNNTGNTSMVVTLYPAYATTAGTPNVAATGSCVVDWAQVEINIGTGDVSSPVGPTTTGSVTRNAETATVDVTSLSLSTFSFAYGVMYEMKGTPTGNYGSAVCIDDGTTNNIILSGWAEGTQKGDVEGTSGGVYQGEARVTTGMSLLVAYKMAVRVALNDLKLYHSNGENGADAGFTLPTGLITLRLGYYSPTPDNWCNGWISEFKLWTYSLSNDRLSALVV